MDHQLLVVRGRSASEIIKLEEGVTIVGRHDECHLKIKSSQVSRQHCHLFEKKGLLLVKDLGSANGTFVNGKRVKEQQVLEPGDELTIGDVQLRVEKIGQPSTAAPQSRATSKVETAIVSSPPIPTAEIDDFEIDFGEEPDPSAATPSPAATPTPTPKASDKPEPKPKSEPEPDAGISDDAVADFLSTIQLDDED
jgi:pSer/pThr/pTyr-binding forkhead associated (FHA) protein